MSRLADNKNNKQPINLRPGGGPGRGPGAMGMPKEKPKNVKKSLGRIITYIGKTATVMVPSSRGEYRDRNGQRYVKYRIPLSRLHQISS